MFSVDQAEADRWSFGDFIKSGTVKDLEQIALEDIGAIIGSELEEITTKTVEVAEKKFLKEPVFVVGIKGKGYLSARDLLISSDQIGDSHDLWSSLRLLIINRKTLPHAYVLDKTLFKQINN